MKDAAESSAVVAFSVTTLPFTFLFIAEESLLMAAYENSVVGAYTFFNVPFSIRIHVLYVRVFCLILAVNLNIRTPLSQFPYPP